MSTTGVTKPTPTFVPDKSRMDSRFESCESERLLALIEFASDETAPRATSTAPDPSPLVHDGVRPHIDGYELHDPIGEGGMGVVWRAVQLSTHRPVALKLLPLSQTQRTRLRFDREVELAARLTHPRIARIYDSGVSGGLSYYAMELIEGIHLDRYVAENELGVRQILGLMRDVCAAVHFAHQHDVIHRDLKPSNILVTSDGQPHVVDFGLAKTTDSDEADLALTRESQSAGTPGFMSPEQAAGRLNEIDKRTDVYGLGATLYLLLTNHLPHDLSGPRYKAIRRIADEEVRRPRHVKRDLPRELELLLLKALAQDPAQRYGSAGELAEEIDRYLRSEPLHVSPPSAVYRMRKFVRRNKGPVAAGAAVLSALVMGLALSTSLYIRAERQRAQAQTQAAIAEAVNQFLSDMLGSADPRKSLGEKLTVLQATDTAVKELDAGRLRDQPLVEASVRATIGQSLFSLGRYDEAEANLRRSLELSRAAGKAGERGLASSLQGLAYVTETRGHAAEAEPLAREALEIRRRNLGPGHSHTTQSVILLAVVLAAENKPAEAEPLLRQALAAQRKALSRGHPDLTNTMSTLAGLLHVQGKLQEAEPLYREVLEARRDTLPPAHPDLAQSLNNLAGLLLAQGRQAEAEPLLSEALDIYRKALPASHPSIAGCAKSLGLALRDEGKFSAAEPRLREALEIYRKILPPEHPDIATCESCLASVLQWEGKLAEAEPLAREAVAINRKSLPPGHWATAQSLNYLANLLLARGKAAEAETAAREALKITRGGTPSADDLNVAWSLSNLAEALKAQGKLDAAESLHRESLEIHRTLLPAGNPKLVDPLIYLANTLAAQGEHADAEPIFREAIEIEAKTHGPTGGRAPWMASLLATSLDKLNRSKDADAIRREHHVKQPATRP